MWGSLASCAPVVYRRNQAGCQPAAGFHPAPQEKNMSTRSLLESPRGFDFLQEIINRGRRQGLDGVLELFPERGHETWVIRHLDTGAICPEHLPQGRDVGQIRPSIFNSDGPPPQDLRWEMRQ